ncbi:MAG: Hint domain-containing protein [Paracoccaceae bacterium]
MATTFTWIYLGNSTTSLDPTEGNDVAENASSFVGTTFGSSTDPLYSHVASVTMLDRGGSTTALDQNNSTSNDQFSTNIGAGTTTYTFDSSVIYDVTITYANGTTATATAVLAQDTAGNLFLAPDPTSSTSPDTAAYQFGPIVSLTLNAITGGVTSYSGLATDRIVTGFDDGIIDGTAGADLINGTYVEPIANGTDRVDGGDGTSGSATAWQDDNVRAGAGNDTVLAGLGNDTVDGGTGADRVDSGAGNDSVLGGSDASADTLFGGAGNDTLRGEGGSDSLYGGAGDDSIDGGDGLDTIYGGGGNDSVDGGAGNDLITETLPAEAAGTVTNGTFASGLTGWTVINPTAGTAPVVSGGALLINSGNETPGGDGVSQAITTTPGSDYTLTISAGETGTGNGSQTVLVEVLDASGNVIASLTQVIANGTTQTLTLNYVAQTSTSTIRITNPASTVVNNSDLLIDNVVNTLVPAATGGNDTLAGGAGDDTILGGAGTDSLLGEADNDSIDGGTEADHIDGGDGNDSLLGGTGTFNDTILGGLGADTIRGDDGADSLSGGDGTDSIDGGLGNDSIDGGNDADSITGGTGADTILGGAGNDTIDGGTEADSIEGGDGNDSLLGGTGNFNDTIRGGLGDDTLRGDDGADSLFGDAGLDSIDGGLGNDTVDGGTEADSVDGGDGNDSLLGGAGAFSDTILGGLGSDTISGDDGADSLLGGDGTDSIDGGLGNDTIDGGNDNDTIAAGDGNDSVLGGGGADFIDTGAGDDFADGGVGNDTILFGTGNDTIFGGDGDDTIDDVVGTNYTGNNSLSGGAGNDIIWGGAGADTISGDDGADNLYGENDDDVITGGAGNDIIQGWLGADFIDGGDDADSLTGDDGNDTITGGGGADTIDGGEGRDSILGGTAGDVISGGEAGDDFDVLDLSGMGNLRIFYDTNPENGTIEFRDSQGNATGTMAFSGIESVVPCFTPGTGILTPQGPRPIESLRVGDTVLTQDNGPQPLRWIGQRRLSVAEMLARPNLAPVRVPKDAFGPGCPSRDLWLSPQHRLLLSGWRTQLAAGYDRAFAAACKIFGQATTPATRPVTYLHLLFDAHEVVIADGLACESLQPSSRALDGFGDANREEVLAVFPSLRLAPSEGPFELAAPVLTRAEARVAALAA